MTVKRLAAKIADLNLVRIENLWQRQYLYERNDGKRVSGPYKILQNYYRYRTQQF